MAGVKGRSGGHNRLPTAMKELTGTLKPGRANTREPQVTYGLADAPLWLSDECREHYDRLGALALEAGVVSTVDGEALALTAKALREYLQACVEVDAQGLIVSESQVDKDGKELRIKSRLNPAATARADAWRRYREGLRMFGLDPQSRGSVMAINGLKHPTPQPDGHPDKGEDFFGTGTDSAH